MDDWKKVLGIVFLLAAAAAGGLYGAGVKYGFNPIIVLPELITVYVAGTMAEKSHVAKFRNRSTDGDSP